ncbi:MAG: hypothetical protein ACMUIP_14635 [bacterium]
MKKIDSTANALGLDVGTSRVIFAENSISEEIKFSTQLNAFMSVPFSELTEASLRNANISYQCVEDEIFVFGNDSAKFANFFNIETRRPMQKGILNPDEKHGLMIIHTIIDKLVKPNKANNPTPFCFSVPGASPFSGLGSNLIFHEGMIKSYLNKLGYTNVQSVNEGLAVILSELSEDNFTGIGISCGGGMCNVCMSYLSLPVLKYSNEKAGDYIDINVGSVTGEKATRVRAIKEESLDLSREPRNKIEKAFHIYYQDVIINLIDSFKKALDDLKNVPRIEKPIPIALAGGTAKPKGFREKFEKELKKSNMPIEVSDVRLAEDPLNTTVRGMLVAASSSASKKIE